MEFYKGKGEFWDKGEKPISDLDIRIAEEKLGVKLPQSYIELLKEHNGGTLKYPKIFLEENDKERFTIPEIDGINFQGEQNGVGILASKYWINEVGLPESIIILWGDYHSWIALKYEGNIRNPSVVYFYEDYLSDNEKWKQIRIGNDFDAFLRKLSRGYILDPKKLKTSYGRKK
ncbi:SMI1/KNR4 family protein [Metabacillus fastidiosus]|uniref:SMI1/KNR4 family protein n=1 Tax=Metabacillus fastidiosus TaxID=1458 RepID=A0ABU6P2C4_9BACI|nr:SMI1/KNR4 family protein [Metabacillus fastidiosus]MED4402296.1 SMI1/KNR4 family protein [Metabacillus fastidiosus]MED4462167.1 SMI1/KNR4 family protein [Metabacillus fastidiosus]